MSSLGERIQALVKGPQFAWWVGHVVLLICTLFYLPYWLTFRYSAGAHWYTRAFLGAILSYGVVVYKSFPEIQFNAQFLQAAFTEENTLYFIMAIYWWQSTPMLAPLIPYAVFAIFNALTYVRTNILALAFGDANTAQASSLSKTIESIVDNNHNVAMSAVALFEIVGVMGSLILGALTFQSSFFSPILYAFFLRFRYFFNPHTRSAFTLLQARLDGLVLNNPKVPPQALKAYGMAQRALVQFGSAAVQQPGTQVPPTQGTSFSESQIVNIKQQFSAMDADGDGLITQTEFLASLQNATRNPDDYDTDLFFAQADKNKDGKISFPEFLVACEHLGLGGQKAGGLQGKKDQREIDAIFKAFDLDGNGVITAKELGTVLERQGEKLTKEELDAMIKAADRNGDNVIDKEEFARMV
ncbi:hypothetical protein CPB97_000600 [Podila verticillata]|nr:hypothetical protein CPB97_000600 [Podila verticillata]